MQVATARAQQAELDFMHIIIYQIKNAWRETLLENMTYDGMSRRSLFASAHDLSGARVTGRCYNSFPHYHRLILRQPYSHYRDMAKTDPKPRPGGPLRGFRHSFGRHCRVELALAVEM